MRACFYLFSLLLATPVFAGKPVAVVPLYECSLNDDTGKALSKMMVLNTSLDSTRVEFRGVRRDPYGEYKYNTWIDGYIEVIPSERSNLKYTLVSVRMFGYDVANKRVDHAHALADTSSTYVAAKLACGYYVECWSLTQGK